MYPESPAILTGREDKKLSNDFLPITTVLFLFEERDPFLKGTKRNVGREALVSSIPSPGEQYSSPYSSCNSVSPGTYSSNGTPGSPPYSSYSSGGVFCPPYIKTYI